MLEIKNVSVKYAGAEAESLCQFSLSVKDGECVLLTGASGCGKTTVTRCLNGLLPNFYSCEMQGEILLDGKAVAGMSMQAIASLTGSVFQDPRSQFFTLDVDSEIAFPCENLGLPQNEIETRVLEAAGLAGITHLLGRRVTELSSGQKQSVAIASACALRPKLLVLDEPSANLDREATRRLRQILLRLKGAGTAILVAEHKIDWLKGLCDRMVYLARGRKRLELSADEFGRMGIDESRRLGLRCVSPFRREMREAAPPDAPEKLRGEQICFRYRKGPPLFEDLAFSLPPGEVIGIVGENGIGKSTLARLCVGLEQPQRGDILLDGKKSGKRERIRKSYYVMQDADYQLFSDSVLGELTIGREGEAAANEAARQILDRLGILAHADRHPGSLSGGEKQRVTIAVALMKNSEMILFDEPTSGLDGRNMRRVSRLLRDLAQQGKTVLVISHDGEFLLETCDRLLHLQRGGAPALIPFCRENRKRIYRLLFSERSKNNE